MERPYTQPRIKKRPRLPEYQELQYLFILFPSLSYTSGRESMNWASRLRWRVTVPAITTLAVMATTALPVAAQAAGASGPGAGPKVPTFRAVAGGTAVPAAQQAPVLPLTGDTPAVAATGNAQTPIVFGYTGSDSHVYEAPVTSPHWRYLSAATPSAVPVRPSSPHPLARAWPSRPGRRERPLSWWHYSSGSPTWISLGGGLTSRPGAAAGALSVPGGEAVDAVVRAGDGSVWDREITSTTLRPWRDLGGRTLAGSGGGGQRPRHPVRACRWDRRNGVCQPEHGRRPLVRLALPGRPRQR